MCSLLLGQRFVWWFSRSRPCRHQCPMLFFVWVPGWVRSFFQLSFAFISISVAVYSSSVLCIFYIIAGTSSIFGASVGIVFSSTASTTSSCCLAGSTKVSKAFSPAPPRLRTPVSFWPTIQLRAPTFGGVNPCCAARLFSRSFLSPFHHIFLCTVPSFASATRLQFRLRFAVVVSRRSTANHKSAPTLQTAARTPSKAAAFDGLS